MKPILQCLLCMCLFSACKEPVINGPTSNFPGEKLEKIEEQTKQNQSRDVWQQPEFVIEKLGDLSDKVVADIGAGTGFFTFRLLFKAKKVIAIDIDPLMIEIIESFRVNLNSDLQNKIETRLALPNDPKIEMGEADVAIIINTIAYIDNRVEYLRNLKNKLSVNGKLMIVDFKSRQLPIEAPSLDYRVPLFQIEKELIQAGFSTIDSDDQSLDYQYVVIAEKESIDE